MNNFFSIGLASDDVRKPSNAWQRGKLVLNKDCVPYKSMLGEKSFAVRSSLFFRREIWTALTTLSQLCASHIKRFRRSDKWGAVFRSIDDFPAWFCMGRCLCLEPILPVATPVATLWRSTCKPYFGNPALSLSPFLLKFSVIAHQSLKKKGFNKLWASIYIKQ